MKLQHLLSETMTDQEWEKHQQAVRAIDNFMINKYGLSDSSFFVVKVGNDLRVDVSIAIGVPRTMTSLGVLFNRIGGNFYLVTGSILESMVGAPSVVNGHMYLDSKHLTSIAGLENTTINGTLDLTESGVKTLSGIHKTHKHLKVEEVYINEDVTNILGLAAIPGVESVTISGTPPHQFDLSHRDVHQFQDQLIDAGFEEQAKL